MNQTLHPAMQSSLLADFLSVAQTRLGVAFGVTTIQKDGHGNISALKGWVNQPNEDGSTSKVDMLWFPNGKAWSQNQAFDLIYEIPLNDFLKESKMQTAELQEN